MVKQRAVYWTAALILYVGSSVLYLLGHYLLGSLLLLFTTVILNYLVLTYRLPDLKFLTFQTACFALTGIIILLLYALGFLILERFFVGLSWYKPVYNGAFFFLIALIFYFPVNRLVRTIFQKLIIKEINRKTFAAVLFSAPVFAACEDGETFTTNSCPIASRRSVS